MRARAQRSDRVRLERAPAAVRKVGLAGARLLRFVIRPFGYLAFVVALAALSTAARLLGEGHELGYFAERLSRTLWRYPEITRPGIQIAWLVWAVLFVISLPPFDPLSTPWNEAGLGAVALIVLWHRIYGEHRAGR